MIQGCRRQGGGGFCMVRMGLNLGLYRDMDMDMDMNEIDREWQSTRRVTPEGGIFQVPGFGNTR